MPKKKSTSPNDNSYDVRKCWIVHFYNDKKQIDVFTLQNMGHDDACKFADKWFGRVPLANRYEVKELQ